jgi:N-acetylneuraminic acid mutarotase
MYMKRQLGNGLVVSVVLLMAIGFLGGISHPAKAALTTEWTTTTPMGNTRSQAVVVQDGNGIVYLVGGFDTASAGDVDNVSSYNLVTGAWTNLERMPVGSRGAAGCAGDGKIYVFGGYNDSTGYLGDTQIYDIASNVWSTGAPMTTRVWEAKAALLNGRCYVMGGEAPSLLYTAAVQIYDPVADSWSAGPSMPVATKAGALVESQYRLIYIGGLTAGGATASVGIYYSWGSWDTATPMPNARVALAAVEGPEGLIYAIGGGSSISNIGVGFNSTYYYNTWSDVWMTGPNLTSGARYLGAAKSTDSSIFALGGNDNSVMLTRVESLRVMTVSLSLSPTTVGAGRTVVITGDVQFAFVTPARFNGYAALVSDGGTTYAAVEFYNPTGGVFAFELSVPQAAAPGPYNVLVAVWIDFLSGGMDLDDASLPLTVTAALSLDQQIASLEQQLAKLETALANATGDVSDLQDEITALQGQLDQLKIAQDDLKGTTDDAKNSASSSNTMGMINLVLLVVVIALLAIVLLMGRKKP